MKKSLITAVALTFSLFAYASPTPLPESLAKIPLVKGTKAVVKEIRPGVTYHGVDLAGFTTDGPLSIHFLVVDWTKVDKKFTLAVVPGKDGNRSRPSDLAKATNAVAAVNGVFHEMRDPYLAYYSRKINGVVSPCKHEGGDGCLAFNRGEMPYIGRFTKEVFDKYDNVISADGVPEANPKEAELTPAQRQKSRAPRTFAGNVSEKKLTIIAVADGRQERSVGLTYGETRRILEAWGCDQLTHLDGGGSSVMVLKGVKGVRAKGKNGPCQIMNVPSDGLPAKSVERRVSESLMLLD